MSDQADRGPVARVPVRKTKKLLASERARGAPEALELQAANDDLIVTLRICQLRQLIRDEVDDALAERQPKASVPELLDTKQMAGRLGVSPGKMRQLRLAGCPVFKVGDTFKFLPAEVIDWLPRAGGS